MENASSISGRIEDTSRSRKRVTAAVGKYRILSELGRGGMANVYLAVARGPEQVSKLVVLKALLSDLASEPSALSMFLDEARVAAQLNHANIVQTYEVGFEGDRHVIVMEYLEGQSFGNVVKRADATGKRLSTALALHVIINVLEGLHYVHELSGYDGAPLMLVHRDVSPQNVFVTYGGQVKLLDFGIAKASSSSTHTATGVVKGKLAYMAPEQMIVSNIDRRADIYSVGCMLWAIATGRKLWKDAPDVHIMRSVINGEVPTPQSVEPTCDDELNAIVMKALAADPDRRYQTALELQADLERYCEGFTGVAKQKELASVVCALFSEKRNELKALIERQLSYVAEPDRDGAGDAPTLQLGAEEAQSASRSNREVSAQLEGSNAALHKPQRSAWPWLAGAALIIVSALGFGQWLTSNAHAERADQAVRAAAAAKAPAAPTDVRPAAERVSVVTVKLSASPPEAELFLDDQKLPSNPSSKLLAADGKVHRLRAEAKGYRAVVQEFSPERDTAIALDLVELTPPAEPNAAQRAGRRGRTFPAATPAASTPKAPASAARTNCAQPFFVSAEGIKKFRPECM